MKRQCLEQSLVGGERAWGRTALGKMEKMLDSRSNSDLKRRYSRIEMPHEKKRVKKRLFLEKSRKQEVGELRILYVALSTWEQQRRKHPLLKQSEAEKPKAATP